MLFCFATLCVLAQYMRYVRLVYAVHVMNIYENVVPSAPTMRTTSMPLAMISMHATTMSFPSAPSWMTRGPCSRLRGLLGMKSTCKPVFVHSSPAIGARSWTHLLQVSTRQSLSFFCTHLSSISSRHTPFDAHLVKYGPNACATRAA